MAFSGAGGLTVDNAQLRVPLGQVARPTWSGKYAAELVSIQPDVILCTSTPTLIALRKETRTVPIVFVMVSDPVGLGQVASMARPGGNVTGFTPFEPSLGGNWVGLLKEIDPRVTRVVLAIQSRYRGECAGPSCNTRMPPDSAFAGFRGIRACPHRC